MAKKNILGAWAFLIGVILAVIVGIYSVNSETGQMTVALLVVLGIIIGILNVTGSETKDFMIAGIVLVLASSLGRDVLGSVVYIQSVIDALIALFVPATIIVALKSVFAIAKN